ncbi:hypothetical protein TrVGV298_006118 [Trichoderma virens]|nr:hypothetical protein TrVGV298_006118 [Trichoderma virens]
MKRSIDQTEGAGDTGNLPAKRAATSTKQAAASTKKASASKKNTSSGKTGAAAVPTSESLAAPNGKCHSIPLGPNGELFIPRILPEECFKAIDKMLLPPRWVSGIDATPDRELTLSDRKWWEENSLWLEANKKSIGLKDKHWKMRDEAYAKGQPLSENDANLQDEFICIHPIEEQKDSDDEDEEDEDEDNNAKNRDKEKEAKDKWEAMHKIVGKFASLHPDHKWVSSLRGYERKQWWLQEILKRDQDDYSLHIYNDFSWYGTIEVLENLFTNFEKVIKRKSHTPLQLWQELEGLALVLSSGLVHMEMCDDADRVGRILELFGFMTAAVIDSLRKNDLFTKDSKIPNISIMLALLIKYAWNIGSDFDGWEDEISWVFHVVQEAETADITLGGPSGFDEVLTEIKDKASEQTAASRSKWTKSTFIKKFGSYGSRGGDQYVIAKMPASVRKKHSYGGGGGGLMF